MKCDTFDWLLLTLLCLSCDRNLKEAVAPTDVDASGRGVRT
jgi:hypothetical protein